MSIPYWRAVTYTDDGCTVYQCLNCYNEWESRSAPWWEYEGKRTVKDSGWVDWVACPVCQVKWEGMIPEKVRKYYKPEEEEKRLTPCKFILWEQFIDDQGNKNPPTQHARGDYGHIVWCLNKYRKEENEIRKKNRMNRMNLGHTEYWVTKEYNEESENINAKTIPAIRLPLYIAHEWHFPSSRNIFTERLQNEKI